MDKRNGHRGAVTRASRSSQGGFILKTRRMQNLSTQYAMSTQTPNTRNQ